MKKMRVLKCSITELAFGAHHCVGKILASKELSILTAKIILHFEISTDESSFEYLPKVKNQAKPFYIKL